MIFFSYVFYNLFTRKKHLLLRLSIFYKTSTKHLLFSLLLTEHYFNIKQACVQNQQNILVQEINSKYDSMVDFN